jgi:hypothetical protein
MQIVKSNNNERVRTSISHNIIFLSIAKAKSSRYYGTHSIKPKPLGMPLYITRGVSHYGLAIYIKKEELCKFKCKNIL